MEFDMYSEESYYVEESQMSSKQEAVRPSNDMVVVQVAQNLTKDGIPKVIVEPEDAHESINQSF